jgi:hypothetical protein
LYGNASVLTRIQQAGLGFLTRARDYQLLTHPKVQARLAGSCDLELVHPERGVLREIYEVGYLSDWMEPLFERELRCRVIVTKRPSLAHGEQVSVGKLLRSRSRFALRNGNLRICFSTKIGDSRSCPLAQQYIGLNACGDKPKQVGGIRTRLAAGRLPKVAPGQEPGEHQEGPPQEAPCELVWCDVGGRTLRRTWFTRLRKQRVNVHESVTPPTQPFPPSSPTSPQLLTRARRAHTRLSWQERQACNRQTSTSMHFHITLFGVAPHVADYLNLASFSPGI